MDQLSSIAEQTIAKDIELIICDDRSTDQTVEMLKSFADTASFPVFFIENVRQMGVLQNFLKAFEMCRAPYIAYCDQDDVWQPDKLERCLEVFQREPGTALVSHSSIITNDNLQPTGTVLPKQFSGFTRSKPHFPVTYWGYGHQMVFSARLVPLIRYFSSVAVEILEGYYRNLDRLIPLCAGMQGAIVYINNPLTLFRRHSQSVSPAGKVFTPSSNAYFRSRSKENGLKALNDSLNEHQRMLLISRDRLADFVRKDGYANYQNYINLLMLRLLSRLDVYKAKRLSERILSIGKAYSIGAYRNESDGGFGPKELFADVYMVVCFFWRDLFDGHGTHKS